MQQRLSGDLDAVWFPCTKGCSIASYLARLQLPATYQDIRERWISLGSPALDTLIRHSTFDSEGRGHDGDLDAVIAGQREFLFFSIDGFSTLGIELPKREFEDIALYIHVRAEIEAELDIIEYGLSDLARRSLYQAYWRRSLSSTKIDHAPCRAVADAHNCLYEQIWGEMGSMSEEETHLRFESLYGAGSSIFSSATSTWSASASSPYEQGSASAILRHEEYSKILHCASSDCCEIPDDLTFTKWQIRSAQLLDSDVSISLKNRSDPAQEEILAVFTNELLRSARTPCSQSEEDLSILQASSVKTKETKTKRRLIKNRAMSDIVPQQKSTARGRRRRLDAGHTFINDMVARFADTYDRFDKSGVAESSLHTELREIFSMRTAGAPWEECITAIPSSPKRSRRAAKRIWLNDKNQFPKLSRIASILNALSQDLSSSRKVVELGAQDIQKLSMSSVLRYQHALLDTWHLYRERWACLIDTEDQLGTQVSQGSQIVKPITTLVNSLSSKQKN